MLCKPWTWSCCRLNHGRPSQQVLWHPSNVRHYFHLATGLFQSQETERGRTPSSGESKSGRWVLLRFECEEEESKRITWGARFAGRDFVLVSRDVAGMSSVPTPARRRTEWAGHPKDHSRQVRTSTNVQQACLLPHGIAMVRRRRSDAHPPPSSLQTRLFSPFSTSPPSPPVGRATHDFTTSQIPSALQSDLFPRQPESMPKILL